MTPLASMSEFVRCHRLPWCILPDMELDHEVCYRAVCSRDVRFDGVFFTGVLTTGIYCRPVCPARTPHLKNCVFFPSAAAAASAGLRPCLRCRPETSPGSPAWQGTSAVVGRALALIDTGALDKGGVEDLAGRLGIGGRHLRRLFTEQLGAAPRAVAMTRRLGLARRLLQETELPVGRIALAVGFGSARRLRSAAVTAWGEPPAALRRRGGRTGGGCDQSLALKLALRPPYAWDDQLAWLGPRAISGVETVTPDTYARTVCVGRDVGRISVQADPAGRALVLKISGDLVPHLRLIVARIRAMFDLDADPQAIGNALKVDPLLAPLVKQCPGLRLPGGWDPFEIAVRAILGQQVSVAAATTLAGRVAGAFGPATAYGVVFPEPAALREAPLEDCGVTGSRAATVRRLARAILAGELDLEPGADPEVVVPQLLRIRGVGPWTTRYVQLRGFLDTDVFPAGDLGLRKACAGGGVMPKEGELERRSVAWRPWRSYAAVHLWRSLSHPTRKDDS